MFQLVVEDKMVCVCVCVPLRDGSFKKLFGGGEGGNAISKEIDFERDLQPSYQMKLCREPVVY